MEQLKSFYIVINQLENRWGKGVTMREAMSSSGSPRTRFEIFQFILKEETPNDVVENLCHCYQVDAYGSVVFYDGKTPEWEKDKKQADEYIIGYTLIES